MALEWFKDLFSSLAPQASKPKRTPRHRPQCERLEDRLNMAGGPIVLLGIDAEDGGPGGHGPITVYQGLINNILTNVTNGGTGMLVVGGGKSATDDVTDFWNAIDGAVPGGMTFVNGANVATSSFSGFALVAVVSDENQTFDGGLTVAENDALSGRKDDVKDFVNGGGGLLGFSSASFANVGSAPYGYLAGLGSFTFSTTLDYDDITPTPEGLTTGVTDALDVFAWHDIFVTFPSFLNVLATENVSGQNQVAAIGGISVTLGVTEPVIKVYNPIRWSYNAKTKIYSGVLTIVNVGTDVQQGPIYVTFRKLKQGVTIENATGTTVSGKPYLLINVKKIGINKSVHVNLTLKKPAATILSTFFKSNDLSFTAEAPT